MFTNNFILANYSSIAQKSLRFEKKTLDLFFLTLDVYMQKS